MSINVPPETTQYQSHQRCKCDFCDSRRGVDAKKFTVRNIIGHTHGARAAPSFELDDPEHHVHQTDLNARTGRAGLPNGDKYTIAPDRAHRARGVHIDQTLNGKSKEQEEQEAMEDLDRLERLLILEHKARMKTAADAEKLEQLQSTGKGPRPQPFDAASATVEAHDGLPPREEGTEGGVTRRVVTHEAYEREGRAVTPPPHCDASHILQHTMDTVRDVTRDPVNRENAVVLQRLLHSQGVPGVTMPSATPQPTDGADASRLGKLWNYFGPRPEGAGVVWRKVQPSMPDDIMTGSGGLGNVDNRDLWKRTLLKGTASRPPSVKPEGKDVAGVSSSSEALSPGASAALSVKQQQVQRKSGSEASLPVSRNAQSDRA